MFNKFITLQITCPTIKKPTYVLCEAKEGQQNGATGFPEPSLSYHEHPTHYLQKSVKTLFTDESLHAIRDNGLAQTIVDLEVFNQNIMILQELIINGYQLAAFVQHLQFTCLCCAATYDTHYFGAYAFIKCSKCDNAFTHLEFINLIAHYHLDEFFML